MHFANCNENWLYYANSQFAANPMYHFRNHEYIMMCNIYKILFHNLGLFLYAYISKTFRREICQRKLSQNAKCMINILYRFDFELKPKIRIDLHKNQRLFWRNSRSLYGSFRYLNRAIFFLSNVLSCLSYLAIASSFNCPDSKRLFMSFCFFWISWI